MTAGRSTARGSSAAPAGALDALRRSWADDLAAWAVPERFLRAAEASPWVLPTRVFSRRAEQYLAGSLSPSHRRALDALPPGGSLLDVGAGGGAASLPLAGRAGRIVAVDAHGGMLADLAARAARLGIEVETVPGAWPAVAAGLPAVDVVVCHHVVYNVADLVPFAAALTAAARRRVVIELPERHPLTALNPYWRRFHGLRRPERPTADQALALLRALGLQVECERWVRPPVAEHDSFDDLVEVTRRRLCLPAARAGEVADALRADGVRPDLPPDLGSSGRHLVTAWWPGHSSPNRDPIASSSS